VAKEGSDALLMGFGHALDLKKVPLDFLAKDFKVTVKELEASLTIMHDLGLIVRKRWVISVPNMEKYTDNWSKRRRDELQRNSVVPTEKLPKEESRVEQIRREESIPLFKKPFYNGMQIREQKGKLFCIPKNGGRWLEFVDKINKIEWK